MPSSGSAIPLESFQTFGDLLKYLRKRARLTQRELAIAIGYSEAQVSRLEKNLRPPDMAALTALFIPALYLEEEPLLVSRLLELAARARGEKLPASGVIAFSQSVQRQEPETARIVDPGALHNLPLQLTSFIGRAQELAEIRRRLAPSPGGDTPARLLTLLGSGGCGKTRLSLEAARQLANAFADGAWFVELAALSDESFVLQTVASALGVSESQGAIGVGALLTFLRTRQLLLILDNCEHLISAIAPLAEQVLRACPNVQILATSREILNVPGEVRFRVPSLALPEPGVAAGDTPAQCDSVALFVERARAAHPPFAWSKDNAQAVAQICLRLDGIPLAIELAAARMSTLSVQELAERLHQSFQFLGGGATGTPRHETLRAAIDWSYDLLSEAERALLRRLSVFVGGCTLRAAEAVVSDPSSASTEQVLDLLSQLVNKSLVIVEWQPRLDTRYAMLESVREYAREKLAGSGEADLARRKHFEHFLSLAREARLFGDEKGAWLDRLEAEHANLRAALAWSLEAGLYEQGAELILPILDFYWFRGYSAEAREWMTKFLEHDAPASPLRALLLQKTGWLTRAGGDFEKADVLLHRALETALEIGDTARAAWTLGDLGLSARSQGKSQEAMSHFSRGLSFARESGEIRAIGVSLYNLAQSHDLAGDVDTSKALWQQGLDLFRSQADKTHIAWGLEGLAGVAFLTADLAGALASHIESLKIKIEVMDKLGIAYSFEGLAQVAAADGETRRAAVLWGAANRLRDELNVPFESSREEIYTSLIPTARQQIGNDAFASAWNTGRSMTLSEAIEHALSSAKG